MINEFIKAASLIFMAEMGDKTQILAMTFATQYMVRHVLSGVAIGVIGNHGLAIILGALIGNLITGELINLIAGALFVFFGWNALKVGDEDEAQRKVKLHPIWTVALAFFIGELGDKTQLTAMALSAESNYPVSILAGTTAGMVGTSGLGIFVGSRLGGKIPEIGLKISSSLVFLGFGLVKLVGGLSTYYEGVFIGAIILLIISVELVRIRRVLIISRTQPERMKVKEAARKLYEMTEKINQSFDSLCLGEEHCGTCAGTGCLLGYVRNILEKARKEENYYLESNIELEGLIQRSYNRKKLEDALLLTIRELVDYGWTNEPEFIMTRVRESLELLLFDEKIKETNSKAEYIRVITELDDQLGKRLLDALSGEAADEKKNN